MINTALADPTVRGLYLMFCFAIMILPVITVSCWYHSRIGRTTGGRELMIEQAGVGGRFSGLGGGFRMASGIAAKRYGSDVRAVQNRTYIIFLLWVILNVIAFGVLLWADEVNR